MQTLTAWSPLVASGNTVYYSLHSFHNHCFFFSTHTVIEARGLLRKENAPFDTYVKVMEFMMSSPCLSVFTGIVVRIDGEGCTSFC